MKKLLFLLLLVPIVSCSSDDEQSETTSSIFLEKHNNTIWAEDTEFYYKSVADIKFSNNEYFISFFDISPQSSNCWGWKVGENIHNGEKLEIEIIRDEEDFLSFRVDHYKADPIGLPSEDIEYSVAHEFFFQGEILYYFKSEDSTVISSSRVSYLPSERNYSEGLDAGDIQKKTGCMFY